MRRESWKCVLETLSCSLVVLIMASQYSAADVDPEVPIRSLSHIVEHDSDFATSSELMSAVQRSGDNGPQIQKALIEVPDDQRRGMQWMILHMPVEDLRHLSAEYLLENCDLAYQAWRQAPWRDEISEAMFFDTILPYAAINERRDNWRRDFRDRFSKLVENAHSPAEAAAILNNAMFKDVGVKYSTKRSKPDQSPYESMDIGMASCTGLSVILIDGCRSVGVPARFVGIPLWSDGSGNHSWVEVWDDGWHFTGAAEPTGDALDQGWFSGRAAEASRENPQNAIYAVTWRKTPISFPLPWLSEDQRINAVDVTDRYTAESQPLAEGKSRVRFSVVDPKTKERLPAQLSILDESGKEVFSGQSKDERFDANDHITVQLPEGQTFRVRVSHMTGNPVSHSLLVTHDQQLVTIEVDHQQSSDDVAGSSAGAVASLIQYLNAGGKDPGHQSFSKTALNKSVTSTAKRMLNKSHAKKIRSQRSKEMEDRVIEHGQMRMPFWYTTFGDAPEAGHSLWISMHGGGGAPPEVNTGQWENQKKLYQLEEGIYVAPRAPTDTWNLWHQSHIDPMFDRLIENMIAIEGVDPNRIYITGYSAGGDGVYQLAPRMADRWAGAGMMAGHPNETKPDGLRNTAFTLHMGAKDAAFKRNQVAGQWKAQLAKLKKDDPAGYDHWVEIHDGKGHWMDRQEVSGLQWMASKKRKLRPKKIVWLQDDVVHPRFYWLANDDPQPRQRIVAKLDNQTVHILETGGAKSLRIRLDDGMVDLDRNVIVRGPENQVLFQGQVPRTIETMAKTLAERGDPAGIFTGEIIVELPTQSSP